MREDINDVKSVSRKKGDTRQAWIPWKSKQGTRYSQITIGLGSISPDRSRQVQHKKTVA
jgi:hypothetical protein